MDQEVLSMSNPLPHLEGLHNGLISVGTKSIQIRILNLVSDYLCGINVWNMQQMHDPQKYAQICRHVSKVGTGIKEFEKFDNKAQLAKIIQSVQQMHQRYDTPSQACKKILEIVQITQQNYAAQLQEKVNTQDQFDINADDHLFNFQFPEQVEVPQQVPIQQQNKQDPVEIIKQIEEASNALEEANLRQTTVITTIAGSTSAEQIGLVGCIAGPIVMKDMSNTVSTTLDKLVKVRKDMSKKTVKGQMTLDKLAAKVRFQWCRFGNIRNLMMFQINVARPLLIPQSEFFNTIGLIMKFQLSPIVTEQLKQTFLAYSIQSPNKYIRIAGEQGNDFERNNLANQLSILGPLKQHGFAAHAQLCTSRTDVNKTVKKIASNVHQNLKAIKAEVNNAHRKVQKDLYKTSKLTEIGQNVSLARFKQNQHSSGSQLNAKIEQIQIYLTKNKLSQINSEAAVNLENSLNIIDGKLKQYCGVSDYLYWIGKAFKFKNRLLVNIKNIDSYEAKNQLYNAKVNRQYTVNFAYANNLTQSMFNFNSEMKEQLNDIKQEINLQLQYMTTRIETITQTTERTQNTINRMQKGLRAQLAYYANEWQNNKSNTQAFEKIQLLQTELKLMNDHANDIKTMLMQNGNSQDYILQQLNTLSINHLQGYYSVQNALNNLNDQQQFRYMGLMNGMSEFKNLFVRFGEGLNGYSIKQENANATLQKAVNDINNKIAQTSNLIRTSQGSMKQFYSKKLEGLHRGFSSLYVYSEKNLKLSQETQSGLIQLRNQIFQIARNNNVKLDDNYQKIKQMISRQGQNQSLELNSILSNFNDLIEKDNIARNHSFQAIQGSIHNIGSLSGNILNSLENMSSKMDLQQKNFEQIMKQRQKVDNLKAQIVLKNNTLALLKNLSGAQNQGKLIQSIKQDKQKLLRVTTQIQAIRRLLDVSSNNDIISTLSNIKQKCKTAQNTIEMLKRAETEKTNVIESNNRTLKQQNRRIEDMKSKVSEKERQYARMQQRTSTLEAEIQRLKKQKNQSISREQQLKMKQDLQQKQSQMKMDLTYQQRIGELQNNMSRISEIKDDATRNSTANQFLQNQKMQLQIKQADNVALANRWRAEAQNANANATKLNAEVRGLQIQLANIKSKYEKVQGDIINRNSEITNKTNAINELQRDIIKKKMLIQNLEKEAVEKQQRFNARIAEFKDAIQMKNSQIQLNKQKIRTQTSDIDQKDAILDANRIKMRDMTAQLTDKEDLIFANKKKLKNAQDRLREIGQQLNQVKRESLTFSQKSQRLQIQIKKKDLAIKGLEQEKQILKLEIDRLNVIVTEYISKGNLKQKDIDDLKQRLETIKRQYQRVKLDLDSSQKHRAELMEQMKRNTQQMSKQLDKKNRQLNQINRKNARLKQENDRLQMEITLNLRRNDQLNLINKQMEKQKSQDREALRFIESLKKKVLDKYNKLINQMSINNINQTRKQMKSINSQYLKDLEGQKDETYKKFVRLILERQNTSLQRIIDQKQKEKEREDDRIKIEAAKLEEKFKQINPIKVKIQQRANEGIDEQPNNDGGEGEQEDNRFIKMKYSSLLTLTGLLLNVIARMVQKLIELSNITRKYIGRFSDKKFENDEDVKLVLDILQTFQKYLKEVIQIPQQPNLIHYLQKGLEQFQIKVKSISRRRINDRGQ